MNNIDDATESYTRIDRNEKDIIKEHCEFQALNGLPVTPMCSQPQTRGKDHLIPMCSQLQYHLKTVFLNLIEKPRLISGMRDMGKNAVLTVLLYV